jgi:hypothetical protein
MEQKLHLNVSQKPAYRGSADFLPPPGGLVKRAPTVKVTLELAADSLKFFKQQAKRNHVPYQRMLRGLIDAYVQRYEPRI